MNMTRTEKIVINFDRESSPPTTLSLWLFKLESFIPKIMETQKGTDYVLLNFLQNQIHYRKSI